LPLATDDHDVTFGRGEILLARPRDIAGAKGALDADLRR
jgi:hypothetical protein